MSDLCRPSTWFNIADENMTIDERDERRTVSSRMPHHTNQQHRHTHTAHVMQAHIRDDNQTKYVIAKS